MGKSMSSVYKRSVGNISDETLSECDMIYVSEDVKI